MSNVKKKLSIGFYLSLLATAVTVAATIVYVMNSKHDYYKDYNSRIVLLSVVVIVLEILLPVLICLMGEKRWLDILYLLPPVLLGNTMVSFIAARVASAGLILGSDLEKGNAVAQSALSQAFLGIGLYLLAIVLSIVRSFMSQTKEIADKPSKE